MEPRDPRRQCGRGDTELPSGASQKEAAGNPSSSCSTYHLEATITDDPGIALGVEPIVPPVWRDETGAPRPVRPCTRCGRGAPVYRFRLEHLRLIGWRLFAPAEYVNRCGHAQEFVVLPEAEGWCRLVPVLGEAR